MKTRLGILSGATMAAAILSAPLALAASPEPQAFMQKAIAGNLAEIKVGQLAQQKGATEGVRHFGTVLEQDHSQANLEARQTANSMGVTPPSEPGPGDQATYRHLASLSGTEFDRAFVKEMVKDHEKDIAVYKKEASTNISPASNYAKQILPDLRKHLQLAEALERNPSG